MRRDRIGRGSIAIVGLVGVLTLGAGWIALAGNLEPPGPPAPTMKTLVEVEPRMAITAINTPGNATYTFVINQPGSYYMTGDLIQDGNKGGILVSADNVTIDLKGFALIGNGGTSSGISTEAPHSKNTTVRNGSVIHWNGIGVRLSEGALVEVVRVQAASSSGIYIDSGIVRDCIVYETVSKSGGSAIYAGHDSLVSGCTTRGNAANGIQVEFRSLVTGCTSSSNGNAGIYLGHTSANRIMGNNVSDNTQNGIFADSNATLDFIGDNHVTGNGVGIRVSGTSNVIVRNTAGLNTTMNYMIAPGNEAGPQQRAATATSAWANIDDSVAP